MKRFKTKQEAKKVDGWWDNHLEILQEKGLFGLPIEFNKKLHMFSDKFHTTDPHPFDSMDIKVRVTPKQSKKLQKKAFKMGYKWSAHSDKLYTDRLFIYIYGKNNSDWPAPMSMEYDSHLADFDESDNTELTYKMWMNGTVPKKKEQPLMFKGHEVEEVDVNMGDFKKFKIGCKELLKNDLRQFMEVCTTALPDADPSEVFHFIVENRTKLGL